LDEPNLVQMAGPAPGSMLVALSFWACANTTLTVRVARVRSNEAVTRASRRQSQLLCTSYRQWHFTTARVDQAATVWLGWSPLGPKGPTRPVRFRQPATARRRERRGGRKALLGGHARREAPVGPWTTGHSSRRVDLRSGGYSPTYLSCRAANVRQARSCQRNFARPLL
jgi:hypothetical protein